MEFKEFTKEYIDTLYRTLNNLNLDCLEELQKLLSSTKGKVFIIGNGGSSATASHMANDLSVGLKRRNRLNLDVISLADNSAVNFALANDIGFENVFYMQLKEIIKKNDILIAISCSGTSANIIKAVEYAKSQGAIIVGFSGFEGGVLKNLADIKIHVETSNGEYGIVEDVHMILNHILFSYFEKGHK
ncbi:sugar isomerase [Arcobacter sp. CECT 8986]|uniref:SIS domain-containing protein n=1 Tax=Arcobacter sp. CECT 8986 TaxID=2044507 RepID=UPI001009FBF2|nr:SIS domain-containing protein [Arcobacter sp. CECT 8986]RXJ98222.1 sugar isomerase [Arcobacter sp. CECT 8986]